MNMKRALLVLGATLIASAPVQAALSITTYTDKATWKAAVSGEQTENFDAEATGGFTNRTFNGFTISSTATLQTSISAPGDGQWTWAGAEPVVNGTQYLAYATCEDTQSMTVNLDEPTQALGFDWNNTDPTGDTAALRLVVDGQTFVFGPDLSSGFFGIVATNGGFSSVLIGDTPGDGGCLEGLGIDDFSFVNADVALFKVTKTFVPASNAPVNVKLECDGGLPLEQTDVVRGGDPDGTTFVLTNTQTNPDCTISEVAPNGYVASAPCVFNGVSNLNYTCAITNTAAPVTFGFTKLWAVDGMGGDLLDRTSELTIQCTQPITGSVPAAQQSGTFFRTWRSTAGAASQSYRVSVSATGQTPRCWVTEDVKDSAVEVSIAGACGTSQQPIPISIGGSVTSCTITNTVFYEGIPTLSQYGMAIMALLMLGVGFVGFRRFV